MHNLLEQYRRAERLRGRVVLAGVIVTFTAVQLWAPFGVQVVAIPAGFLVFLAVLWHWQADAIEHRAWTRWHRATGPTGPGRSS